jgi:uncharacterized protein (TIGR02284 family)
MSTNNQETNAINRLIGVAYDSARGYLIAAQTANNRGLKTLLRSYARQRFQFVAQLEKLLEHHQDEQEDVAEHGSFLGGVHRGWIIIKTAMTLGPQNTEDVLFSEVVRGEKYALDQYDRVLQMSLNEETQQLVQNQRERIEDAFNLAYRMKGRGDKRLVVRLYNSDQDVSWARRQLEEAGFEPDSMQEVAISQLVAEELAFEEEEEVTANTVTAAALIGLAVGLILGFLAGIGVMFAPTLLTDSPLLPLETLLVSTVGGALAGAFIAGLFGFFIGRDVTVRDAYVFGESVPHGQTLLMVESDPRSARRAARIMKQVDAATAIT